MTKKSKNIQNQESDEKCEKSENFSETQNLKHKNRKRKKIVNFTEDTIDNTPEIDEKPENIVKKSKKPKNDIIIKPGIPTEDELIQCDKPENKKATISKRQRKKEKYNALIEKQKLSSQLSSMNKNLNYLSSWKHNRSEWKFEKNKQSWLQKNMFNSELIPNEHWETLVQYFSSAKGQVRSVILKECMDIIEKYEKNENEEENDIKEIRFKRARDMLQSLEE